MSGAIIEPRRMERDAKIMQLYLTGEHGIREIARMAGVSHQTVLRVVAASETPGRTEAEVRAAVQQESQRVAKLALSLATEAILQMFSKLDDASAMALNAIAGTAIDKYRLLTGQPTAIEEQRNTTDLTGDALLEDVEQTTSNLRDRRSN